VLQDKAPHPLIRLDYIFLSESIVHSSREAASDFSKLGFEFSDSFNIDDANQRNVSIITMVEKTDMTHSLSDHYPITTAWLDSHRQDICLY